MKHKGTEDLLRKRKDDVYVVTTAGCALRLREAATGAARAKKRQLVANRRKLAERVQVKCAGAIRISTRPI